MCMQVMVDGVPSRREMHYGDRWFLVRIAPYTGTDRQVRGAVLTFTNFTAFRASLGQAIYEREYTKTILNAVIDPLVVLDDGLQVQDGQSRLLRMVRCFARANAKCSPQQSGRPRLESIRVVAFAAGDSSGQQ